jgi:hypothetical protein
MTWRDFSLYVLAAERKELNEWARTRRLAYMIYCSVPSDKTKSSERSFWPLPIDEEEEKAEPLSDEQLAKVLKFYMNGNGSTQN